MLEANIDDMTGEMAGYAMEELFEEGALDVFYTPIYMKKNRPAIKLGVLAKEEDKETLEKAILKHTTTIGVRSYEVQRTCMERHFEKVSVKGHDIRVKTITHEDVKQYMPEYEDCKKVAKLFDMSIQEVYYQVVWATEEKYKDSY